MKHKINQALFDYWNVMRGGRPAPFRADIQPGDIKRLLPNLFILERKSEWDYAFRLAGTKLCNTYGMEFRHHNLLSMWQDDCNERLRTALREVTGDAMVSLVEYTASTNSHREASFEMLLLPLAQDNGALTRVLGAAVPLDDHFWIGDQMLARQWIDRLQMFDPDRMPKRMPAIEPSQRIIRERPPVPAVSNIANLANRRPMLRGERTYLRLVNSQNPLGERK